MGTQIGYLPHSSFNGFCVEKKKMFLFGGSFWVSVFAVLYTFFGFFSTVLSRIRRNKISQAKKLCDLSVSPQESNRIVSGCFEAGDEQQKGNSDSDEIKGREGSMSESEEESSNFCFKFEFQTDTFMKLSKSYRGITEDVLLDSVPSSSTSKYEFLSGKDFSCFLEKPEDVSFNVRELYADSDGESDYLDKKEDSKNGYLPEIDEKSVLEEKLENSSTDSVSEKPVHEPVSEEEDVDSGNFQFLSEKDLIGVDSDVDSNSKASTHENTGDFLGSTSISDGFLSDFDFEETFELDLSKDFGAKHEDDDFEDENTDIMEELRKLEDSEEPNSQTKVENSDSEVSGSNHNDQKVASDDSKKPSSDNLSTSDSDEGLETLWEHQDLLEQLKMELKKVRASGLPTILEEESECPKIMEDLKPWKIDEKFQQVDRMGELHKFYKSYRERMRKFDILNYQKMYAIGFFQSKDPLQSFSTHKSSSHPAFTSLLPQNLRLGKSKKLESDPTVKFIRELHTDLEAVYVAQMCLSWEILHWQYEKALELWESDQYSVRRYNEVAGEFQQFQVLMERFIEDERFEGPRVQTYAKKRCVLRNLLQVPVIREDKVKCKGKGKEAYTVTSDTLVEIMEESIRIFWRFVRADKDANFVLHKCRKGTQIEPLEPNDLQLLAEVQTTLQKKEKKLKELLRSGNCMLRKFQKQKEENSDQVLYFFSQVDMKLVARVLNMNKVTTDQLLWCRGKLSRINFVNRRIHVEPFFLLFPY